MKKQCSPGFSLSITAKFIRAENAAGKLVNAVLAAGGEMESVCLVGENSTSVTQKFKIRARDLAHQGELLSAAKSCPDTAITHVEDDTFACHVGGKLRVASGFPLEDAADLSRLYTPGVARICKSIAKDKARSFAVTQRRNMVAVISDGSAILGLGNLGPEAALPVMEGKSLLFKKFAGVDSVPIVVGTQDADEIVKVAAMIAPTFGGINLEDISAPRCFEVEEKLQKIVDIPVFHDDQHGTAIVATAGLTNAAKVVGKKLSDLKIIFMGVGAAGTAVTKLFQTAGVRDIIGVNRSGVLWRGKEGLNVSQKAYAEITNPDMVKGTLRDVIKGADVFVGLSGPDTMDIEDVKLMAPKAIIFAMSNPDPEIRPEIAAPHVAVMATGRSDYPNQINNVLAFPGLFRGALDVRASRITPGMNLAAARAIASIAEADGLNKDNIIPNPFDVRVPKAVAEAVMKAAKADGVARDVVPMPGVGSLSDV
ncbi:MAG: NADP-dependent malic enzyme [Planctomycetota bacterium]|jgi:malate dehydrogenase (oxaloacetate-decarboxylating)|nr:NADP-dependent malic enzyme [Planctomycetota bacterium]